MKIQKSKVDWVGALAMLSPNAYYLLNALYHTDVDGLDAEILKKVPYGKSTYDKAKRELVSEGYLKVVQVKRHTYKYIVGIDKVEKDNDKFNYKELVDSMIDSHMILTGKEPSDDEVRLIKQDANEILASKDEARLLDEIKGIDV